MIVLSLRFAFQQDFIILRDRINFFKTPEAQIWPSVETTAGHL